GRRKAQPIESVIDAHLAIHAEIHRFCNHPAQQRHGKKTVSHRSAEGRLAACALGIDVDPLPISRHRGELIDQVLADLQPLADTRFYSDRSLDVFNLHTQYERAEPFASACPQRWCAIHSTAPQPTPATAEE